MKYSIVLIVVIAFMSCSNRIEEHIKYVSYEIVPSDVYKWNLEEVIDTSFIVSLETSPSSLLGNLYKVEIDCIIGVSDNISNSLFLYTLDGKLLSNLSNKGLGPGEFVQISDFVISPQDSTVKILDAMQKKILIYSWDGRYIEENRLSLNSGVSMFSMLNDTTLLLDQQIRRNEDEWQYRIIIISDNGEVLDKVMPYTEFADVSLSARRTFFSVNDTLAYLPTYSNVLYSIVGNKAVPRFKLDFGSRWTKEDYVLDKTKDPMSFVNGLSKTDFVYFVNVLETSSHIRVDYSYKGKNYNTLIRKSDNKVATYLRDDDECRYFYTMPIATWNNHFVLPMNKRLNDMTKEFQEDDNPYLLFVKFK